MKEKESDQKNLRDISQPPSNHHARAPRVNNLFHVSSVHRPRESRSSTPSRHPFAKPKTIPSRIRRSAAAAATRGLISASSVRRSFGRSVGHGLFAKERAVPSYVMWPMWSRRRRRRRRRCHCPHQNRGVHEHPRYNAHGRLNEYSHRTGLR